MNRTSKTLIVILSVSLLILILLMNRNLFVARAQTIWTEARATTMPNPTIIPATPGPSPTPEAEAYPYPAPQSDGTIIIVSTPPPYFTARWKTPSVIRLSWIIWRPTTEACIIRLPKFYQPVLVQCLTNLSQTRYIWTMGSRGPIDGAYRAAAGDSYVLTLDGIKYQAELKSVWYFPVLRS